MKDMSYKFNEGNIIQQIERYVDSTYERHYASGKYQATDMIIDAGHGEGFCMGNIMKYAMRCGKKEGTDAEATLSGTTREELDKSINDARSNLIKKLTKLRMDQNKFLNARFRELGGVPATSKPKRPTSKKEQQKDSKRSELKNLINP